MESIIKVEGLGKQYRLGQVGTGSIKADLKRWSHRIAGREDPFLQVGDINDRSTPGTSEYVWALKDISFEVLPGEVLGIIGRNGAGKSTLLKILSRVTEPTRGRVELRGRVASLLEVGTGFHPDLTGRENIFLNGAILGMTKKEITRKLDEIIDFAGVERYIDTPVKRYSSGMHVRLGFAVAAHLEPDILIVDEVLAVGDIEFQKKCLGKMQEVSETKGRTVLFVSHNLGAIKELCPKSMLLHNGSLKYIGSTTACLNEYASLYDMHSTYYSNGKKKDDIAFFHSIELLDNDRITDHFDSNNSAFIKISFEIVEEIKSFNVGYNLRDSFGTLIYASADTDVNPALTGWRKPGIYYVLAPLPLFNLNTGSYNLELVMGEMNIRVTDRQRIGFTIQNKNFITGGERPGLLLALNEWNYIPANELLEK